MSSFRYQIKRSKRLTSNTSISISPEKGVVVRAPFWMPQGMIESFIREKSDWIEKHLDKITSRQVRMTYENGEKHLFFGTGYPLEIISACTPGRCQVDLINEKIQVIIYDRLSPSEKPQKIKDALQHWYLEKGIEIITEKVNFYASQIGVTYQRISLKNVSSIWGSCSPTNCLSFNRKLVMAPHKVVDYVVIHEVSHMVHRNHGHGFWELVSRFDPQYKSHRRWLRLNHQLLTV